MRNSLVTIFSAGLLLSACSTADYDRIPRTGFISHYQKADQGDVPFASYWVAPAYDQAACDKTLEKERIVCVKPVTLTHYNGKPATAAEATAIEQLCSHFDQCLQQEFAKAAAKHPQMKLTGNPKGAWVVEIALLDACSASTGKNLVSGALGQITGGGFLWGRLISTRDERTGYLAMAARIYDPQGKLIAEVADFAYGMSAPVDTKDYRPYAYQRRTVEQWAEDFATLSVSPFQKRVNRTSFSLNPF